MAENTQIVITELPKGELAESHFETRAGAVPKPADGQVLLRTILLSLDAANRAWMQGATYREAVEAGDVMHGYGIAEVVESQSERFAPGDLVAGETGWQTYAALDARKIWRVPKDFRPLSHLLSLLGIAGKTAYHGLLQVGRPQAGETVLVSAAAGSVGSYVGQIAKIKGCRAVGIAGGPEKCAWIVDELGFDDAIDYRAGKVGKAIAARCPEGVDVYFDNVGGPILEAALFNMNQRGRIVCCGAISQYDTEKPESPRGIPGVLIFKRLRMEGFIVLDFADKDRDAERDLAAWATEGKLKVIEDVLDGLEAAPQGLVGLLHGANRGKRMVRVGPDPA